MYFGYRRLYAAEPVFCDCTCTTNSFSSDLVIVSMFAFIIAALIVFAVLLIYCLIERQIIITRKQDIYLDSLPSSFNGFRILQISDLHHREFGKDQKRIIKRVIKIKPDAVFITGDLISRDMRDFSSVSRFCSQLSSIAPVFFSMGNHELDLPEKVRSTYFECLRNSGVILLLNNVYHLKKSGEVIDIIGASLDTSVYRNDDFSYQNLNPYSEEELVDSIGVRIRCTVLLAHNPLIFDVYASWNADLVLSGHVHGGVVRLPFIGGILSPERRFFPSYTRGLYSKNYSQLYVSAGLGKLRFFNPPEINVISLYRKS